MSEQPEQPEDVSDRPMKYRPRELDTPAEAAAREDAWQRFVANGRQVVSE